MTVVFLVNRDAVVVPIAASELIEHRHDDAELGRIVRQRIAFASVDFVVGPDAVCVSVADQRTLDEADAAPRELPRTSFLDEVCSLLGGTPLRRAGTRL